jgi:hypothetical protein
MGRKQILPKPPLPSGGRRALASDAFHPCRSHRAVVRWATRIRGVSPVGAPAVLGGGRRGPPISLKEQGRWVAPPALIMPHAVRNFSHEGITRAITTVYYRAGWSGNRRFSTIVP